tara:strand:- start:24 stop:779 length:756 start_codon:yes stop_codon:yes gene_type:complete
MRAIFVIFIFLLPLTIYSQINLPYKVGEYSKFEISFGGIEVGTAELEIVQEIEIDDIAAYHIIGRGKTNSFFDFFFKVRDVYETYLDILNIRPLKFIRKISEGGYKKTQFYRFNHFDRLVFFEDTSYSITSNSQDMLSALFFARTFSKRALNNEKSFYVPIFMDEENYSLEISYIYNEDIETDLGIINCMVFKPKMQEGRVFQDGEKMKIWISNDDNNLLIKVETKIWAGTIKAILVKHSELKYPLSITID